MYTWSSQRRGVTLSTISHVYARECEERRTAVRDITKPDPVQEEVIEQYKVASKDAPVRFIIYPKHCCTVLNIRLYFDRNSTRLDVAG